MKISIGSLAAALLATALPVPAVLAQTPSPAPAPRAIPAEEYVTEKGFKSSVFEVKHRDPSDLATVLRPLSSGFRGAVVSANRDSHTISVRDFPENIAAIDAAIKRLDVAEAPRADVDLHIWVLVASNGAAGGTSLPEELVPVASALKSTLQYRNYGLAASYFERVRDGSRSVGGEGTAQVSADPAAKGDPPQMQSEYQILQVALEPGSSPARIRLDGFRLALIGGGGRAQVRTDVTVREGEKVVVGTSTVHGRALVVVLSAKVVR